MPVLSILEMCTLVPALESSNSRRILYILYCSGGEREVYGSREISREIYASPQQHSRDVYASPSHRIVYSTESPKGKTRDG